MKEINISNQGEKELKIVYKEKIAEVDEEI